MFKMYTLFLLLFSSIIFSVEDDIFDAMLNEDVTVYYKTETSEEKSISGKLKAVNSDNIVVNSNGNIIKLLKKDISNLKSNNISKETNNTKSNNEFENRTNENNFDETNENNQKPKLLDMGLKIGYGFSTIYGDDVTSEVDSHGSAKLGGFASKKIDDLFSIKFDYSISVKGYRFKEEGGYASISFFLIYFDLSPSLCFHVTNNFKVYLGLYLSPFLFAEVSTEGIDEDVKVNEDRISALDYGYILGMTFEFGKIILDFEFSRGLKGILKEDIDVFNEQVIFSIGMLF